MGVSHSVLNATELKDLYNIDIDKLWNEFIKDCCEVASGNFTPYFVMDSAFLTYAINNLELYDLAKRNLAEYQKNNIMKSLSYHLAKLMEKNGIVPSWGWKSQTHFITSELCIGINVKSLPHPTIKKPFTPFICGPN